MQDNRIIIIGSYLVALVMNTRRIPMKGETLLAHNFRQTHGGKGSNQAVQAARLGASTGFIGFVGDDSFGDSFKNLCISENIDTSKIRISEKYATGAGFIISSEDGYNIITIDIGANNEMVPVVIDELTADICPGDFVLIQFEIPVESALYAAKLVKKKGAIVILNPAPATNLIDRDLSFIDFITPNETELRLCCGFDSNDSISDEDAAKKLHQLGCRNVIVTQGDNGCLLLNKNGFSSIPAFKFSEIVDSTGAGDSFNAALAVALLENKSPSDACKFANASAGLACTKHDTVPSYHFRQDVDKTFNR